MTDHNALKFTPNKTIETARGAFIDVHVDTGKVLESWRESIFSFEWLDSDGNIKPPGELSAREQPKRAEIEQQLKNGAALEMPVLGIGLSDNIEIGSGRAVLLTLAALGYRTIPVHIPKSNEKDFKPFLVKG